MLTGFDHNNAKDEKLDPLVLEHCPTPADSLPFGGPVFQCSQNFPKHDVSVQGFMCLPKTSRGVDSERLMHITYENVIPGSG